MPYSIEQRTRKKAMIRGPKPSFSTIEQMVGSNLKRDPPSFYLTDMKRAIRVSKYHILFINETHKNYTKS